MTPPRRILLVVNDLPFLLSHRLPLAVGARARGYDVHVATPDHPRRVELEQQGIHFHPFPLSRSGVGPLAEFRSLLALARLYRRLRPDLVHQVTIKPVLYGSLAARLAAVPAVVNAVSGLGHVFSATGGVARLRRAVVVQLYRTAMRHPHCRVIFQNDLDRDHLLAAGIVQPRQVVMIRGSGVDLDTFVPRPEPAGRPVVLLAARMLWDKGVGDFVAAARTLRPRHPDSRFVLVGTADPGNPGTVPENQLRAWHEEGVIEWWQQRNDMPDVMAGAAIICLPSVYREGVPKVLLEGAAAGRPIVTTDVPGCRDTIIPGQSGLLVAPGDRVALASAIETLLRDPALRATFGARGRALAVERFSVQAVVDATMGLYQELLYESFS